MTAALQERQPRLPPAYRLVTLDSVESTNDEAKRLAREGAEDGTLVWAREQRRGRGRYARNWASPRGNLYLSVVLRPDCAPGEAAQLSFVAALAVGDAVGSIMPPLTEVHFKWPNDILVNRRKAAGILLESSSTPAGVLDWLVLGIGLNISSFPAKATVPATSLRFEGCPEDVTEIQALEAVSRHLLSWVNRWLEDGFEPIRRALMYRIYGLGEEIEVRLANDTVRGLFRDLDKRGGLVLELPDGSQRTITAGDVHLRP